MDSGEIRCNKYIQQVQKRLSHAPPTFIFLGLFNYSKQSFQLCICLTFTILLKFKSSIDTHIQLLNQRKLLRLQTFEFHFSHSQKYLLWHENATFTLLLKLSLQLSSHNNYAVFQSKHSRDILSPYFDKLSIPVAEERLCGYGEMIQQYK